MKVSIISGIYFPPEDLFRKFIESCLNTTLDEVEFILVFDDPNDSRSRQILESYKKDIDNNKNTFKVIENKKNQGIKLLREEATKTCTGDYVMYFGSDDFFDNDYIESLYNYADKYSLDCVRGYMVTHYFGNIDVTNNNIGIDASAGIRYSYYSDNEQLYMIKAKDSDFSYGKFIKIVDGMTEIPVVTLPLCFASYYHYVRHDKSMTAVSNNVETNDVEGSVDSSDHFDKKYQGLISTKRLMKL